MKKPLLCILSSLFSCALGLVLTPGAARAECNGTIDLESSTLTSDAVVYGRVTSLEVEDEARWVATVHVLRPFKGNVREKSTLKVSSPLGDDEVDWSANKDVVLYMKRGREKGVWSTSKCFGSKSVDSPPLAADTDDFFPVPPADAPLKTKARRASAIFTGTVKASGRAYAGNWHGVTVKVKVKDAIKGVKRNKTIELQLDGDSCKTKEQKRDLLSDVDILQGDASSPFEQEESYLFFAYDEKPYQVMLCYENMQRLDEASRDVDDLKRMCKKGKCKSGHDEVNALRQEIKGWLELSTRSSLKTCAKELPLYSKEGAITDLSLQVRLQPAGEIELLNVESRGTITEGKVYTELGDCMAREVSTWEAGQQDGRPDLEGSIKLRLKESSRGPKVERAEVTLSGR